MYRPKQPILGEVGRVNLRVRNPVANHSRQLPKAESTTTYREGCREKERGEAHHMLRGQSGSSIIIPINNQRSAGLWRAAND